MAVAIVAGLPLPGACGDDDQGGGGEESGATTTSTTSTSTSSVCPAASDLEAAVQQLGDVDVAEDGTDALRSATDDVGAALQDLGDAASSQFGDDLTAAQSTFDALREAVSSVDEAGSIQAAAQSVRQPLSDFTTATETLVTNVSQGCD